MDFDLTERQRFWRDRVREFMAQHVIPRQQDYYDQQKQGSRWKVLQVVEDEKARAKAAGIWNLFMPPTSGRVHVDDSFEFDGPGLTTLNMRSAPRKWAALAGAAPKKRGRPKKIVAEAVTEE
jgi:alkylation response protein AidB-like acyl-CoA dehydrogenase